MTDYCILCGTELTNKNKSIEHSPPQNFVDRMNLLTGSTERIFISIKENVCKICNNNSGYIEAIFNLDLFGFALSSKELTIIEDIQKMNSISNSEVEKDLEELVIDYSKQLNDTYNGDILLTLKNSTKPHLLKLEELMNSYIKSKNFKQSCYSIINYENENPIFIALMNIEIIKGYKSTIQYKYKNSSNTKAMCIELTRGLLLFFLLEKILKFQNNFFYNFHSSIKNNHLSSPLFIYKLLRVISDLDPKLLVNNQIFLNVSKDYVVINNYNVKFQRKINSYEIFNIKQSNQKEFAFSKGNIDKSIQSKTLVGKISTYKNGIEILFYNSNSSNDPNYGFSIINEKRKHILTFKYYINKQEYTLPTSFKFMTKESINSNEFHKIYDLSKDYICEYNYQDILKKADTRI